MAEFDSSGSARTLSIIFIIILAVALLFGLRSAEQTGDALRYAVSIKTSDELFHPHHLLFVPFVQQFFLVLSALSSSVDAVFAAQIHNICWAVIAVISFYYVMARLLENNLAGLLAAVALLLSFGFWSFSTQVEVYVPAAGCLSLIFALLVSSHGRNFGLRETLLASLLLSLAIFYHQTNVLFCVPLGCYLLVSYGKGGVRAFSLAAAVSGFVVLVIYIIVFICVTGDSSPGGFVNFCLQYTYHPNPNWGNLENLGYSGIATMSFTQLRNIATVPYRLSDICGPLFGLFTAAVILWNVLRSIRRASYYKIRIMLVVWLIVYYLFFLWWYPGNQEFFIATLLPLLSLSFLSVRDIVCRFNAENTWIKIAAGATAAFVLVMFFVNITVITRMHRSRGAEYDMAEKVAAMAPTDAWICVEYFVMQNLRYYFEKDSVLDVEMPLTWLYNDMAIPDNYRLPPQKEIIVPVMYVVPEYPVGGVDGNKRPDKWEEYLKWLFTIEPNPKSAEVRFREFYIQAGDDGDLYLRLSKTAGQSTAINELLADLDEKIRSLTNDETDMFQAWYRRYHRSN